MCSLFCTLCDAGRGSSKGLDAKRNAVRALRVRKTSFRRQTLDGPAPNCVRLHVSWSVDGKIAAAKVGGHDAEDGESNMVMLILAGLGVVCVLYIVYMSCGHNPVWNSPVRSL